MLIERVNETHWTWLVYLEMLVAGIAAGAYVAATILELSGRGRSPVARTAHLIALPMMLLAAPLLVADLSRPDRFWHMVIMSERGLPMLKPWSVISLGTWLVAAFSGVCFISFVDALISLRVFGLGGWRYDRTIHGGPLGIFWSMLGALLAFGVGIYSGVLMTATNFPGWAHAVMIPAVYVATAMITGVAAVVLVRALRGAIDVDVMALAQTNLWLIGWWLVMMVLLVLTVVGTANAHVLLGGIPLLALGAAVVLAGILPLLIQSFRPLGLSGSLALASALVLAGGFCLRYGLVMAPQLH
jgi:formate-dependent nitrite reductase membrane component NrfD